MKSLKTMMMALCLLTAEMCVAQNSHAEKNSKSNIVEVLYFHGKKRCVTCNAIEKLSKEVVDTDFAQQQKEGKVIFKTIDISTPQGEKIADKYEVTWSSLFVNRWKNGKESKNNMTEFGFSNAKRTPETFKTGLKKKITELLK